jgi:hypothetical protein
MGIGKCHLVTCCRLSPCCSLGTNWEKVRSIEREPIPECDELKRLGVLQ